MINKFRLSVLLSFCVVLTGFSQTQSKKYEETFNVDKDVVLNINTSHTNIEFETWNKNTIEVTGLIEIEDATKEEAEAYFKNWNFKALGNSKEVTVSCNRNPAYAFVGKNTKIINSNDFNFVFEMPEIAEIPEVAPLVMEMTEMPPLPPMPPMPMSGKKTFVFDYEAYKKEGDAYLEKWKKSFNENYDEDFKKEMNEWKTEMKKYKEEVMKLREERAKERAEMREEIREEREEHRKEQAEIRAERRKEAHRIKVEIEKEFRDKEDHPAPHFYFYSSDGKEKHLKVKKTIKIKMPKKTRLKLNVRHGEVKLAENTTNIKATLSHTRLLANVVDGTDTFIEASYSPVKIEDWKYGELKVNYIKEVTLDRVQSLKLTSNSSDVNIGLLEDEGFINSSFGQLDIKNIADKFTTLDVELSNDNAVFILPKEAFTFFVKSENCQLDYPGNLIVTTEKKYSSRVVKGYFKNAVTPKSVKVNARYSKIVFK